MDIGKEEVEVLQILSQNIGMFTDTIVFIVTELFSVTSC